MEYLGILFSSLLTLAPLILVWLAGIFMAATRYHENPNRYRLAIIGLVILFISGLASIFISLLPIILIEANWDASQIGVWLTAVRVIVSLISATGYIFLLAAVFKDGSAKAE